MTKRRTTMVIAALGVAAVAAYAVWAALQILVWNPLAAAPGATLPQIHADMATWNESPGVASTIAILSVGPALALLTLVLLARSASATPRVATAAFLGILAGGAPAYFVASFGPGMSLADTYGISGADHSPAAIPLYLASLTALIAMPLVLVLGRRAPGSPGHPIPA